MPRKEHKLRKRSRKIDRMLPLGKWRKISYHFPKANAISPYNNSFICSICNKKMHMKLHYGNYVCIYCYGKALKSICEGGIMDITPVNVGGYMQEKGKNVRE